MTTECPTCGRDDFSSEMGMKQHHSKTHDESIAGRLVSCDICDKEYRVKPSNEGGKHFCSDECQGEWMSNIKTEEHWNYHGGDVVLSCNYCYNFYTVKPSKKDRSSYCSKVCQHLAYGKINGKDHPQYNRKEVCCDWCNDYYMVKNYRSDDSRFCSTDCRHDWLSSRTGEAHPLYDGGEHSKYKQRDWRIFSKKYRNWVGCCENCGDTGNLQTHHNEPISMGGGLYDNTFTVLCSECHYGDFEKWHPPQLEEYIDQNS